MTLTFNSIFLTVSLSLLLKKGLFECVSVNIWKWVPYLQDIFIIQSVCFYCSLTKLLTYIKRVACPLSIFDYILFSLLLALPLILYVCCMSAEEEEAPALLSTKLYNCFLHFFFFEGLLILLTSSKILSASNCSSSCGVLCDFRKLSQALS